jgi:hypothetical protein
MNRKSKSERSVIIKRHHKSKNELQQNAFINIKSIGNCTICKLSIAILIAASFFVVKPKTQYKYNDSISKDSLITSKPDTLHIVKLMNFAPTGIIVSANQ